MSGQSRNPKVKSPTERENYLTTTVRQSTSPTADAPLVNLDTTDAVSAAGAYEPTGETKSTKPESAASRFLREKWAEIVVLLLFTVLIGFMIGLNEKISSLNRENGELKTQIIETRLQLEQIRQDLKDAKTETAG